MAYHHHNRDQALIESLPSKNYSCLDEMYIAMAIMRDSPGFIYPMRRIQDILEAEEDYFAGKINEIPSELYGLHGPN